MSFAEDLKTARKAAYMTQQSLSDALNIPKRTIENWETNKMQPPVYVQQLVLEKISTIANS